jgi:hypothetical protein
MAEREVQSPVSRKGSKVGSGQPLGPGARSDPSRPNSQQDSVPSQPAHTTSRHSTEEPPLPSSSPDGDRSRGRISP